VVLDEAMRIKDRQDKLQNHLVVFNYQKLLVTKTVISILGRTGDEKKRARSRLSLVALT
jgi:hypothetical protein